MPNRSIEKIIVHCSVSDFGNASLIDVWHKERGWDGIGYHCVITNGHLTEYRRPYRETHDGIVQDGRSIDTAGAHCRGYNHNSIGLVLIGRHHFTPKQLLVTLPEELFRLCFKYDIDPKNIHRHSDFNENKTCPNIPDDAWEVIIEMVKAKLEGK